MRSHARKAFVNSLPKSGTNLVIKALLAMGMREAFHLSAGRVMRGNLTSRLRGMVWRPIGDSYLVGINTPVEVARWPVDLRLRWLRRGAFGSGHVGYDRTLLEAVKRNGIRPVLMTRDPRAVLVSGIDYVLGDRRHALHERLRALDEGERILHMLMGGTADGVRLVPLRERCMALEPWFEDSEVLWLRFEDLVGSRGGGDDERQRRGLEALAAHLGIDASVVGQVAADLWGPGRATFRRGSAEGWREAIPEQVLADVDAELRPVLAAWGYS